MSMIKLAGGSGYGLDVSAENPKAADNVRRVSHKDVVAGGNVQFQHDPNSAAQMNGSENYESPKADTKDMFEALMEELRQDLNMEERQVEFSYNQDLRQMVVTVTDKNNGSVVRQIPEEYVLKMVEKFQISGRIEGLLINDKV